MNKTYDICIIGAGAAGLMAAITACRGGAKTAVFEKNTNVGRKLLITGGSRCNITHELSPKQFTDACQPYHRFLKHCIYDFTPQQMISFINDLGVETVTESDGCVFPASHRAVDVVDALCKEARKLGVDFYYDKPIEEIVRTDSNFTVFHAASQIEAERIIIATGGLSYPKTGSTGDGYEFAKAFSHTIVPTQSCLVPLVARQSWAGRLSGVGVKDASLLIAGEKKKNRICGPVIFTADGIGGPAVINFSRRILPMLKHDQDVQITIDLLANQTLEQSIEMFNELCRANPKKELTGLLSGLFPRSVTWELASMVDLDPSTRAAHLPKKAISRLINLIKSLPLTIIDTKPIRQATVTRGGVCTDQIDTTTMQSKLCPNLFFAGEVMDVDGPCGGYNLQIAFSTAVLAASSALK